MFKNKIKKFDDYGYKEVSRIIDGTCNKEYFDLMDAHLRDCPEFYKEEKSENQKRLDSIPSHSSVFMTLVGAPILYVLMIIVIYLFR